MVPILRQSRDKTTIQAAAIGSKCIIALESNSSGVIVPKIYLVNETVEQWVLAGHITAVTTTASGKPSTISYKFTSDDGLYTTTVFEAPLYRPYSEAVNISPALVGSECQIMIVYSGGSYTAYLWSVREYIDFGVCGTGDGYQYSIEGEAFDPTYLIVNPNGEEIVNASGNLILSKDATAYTNEPESQVVTSKNGYVVFDYTGANAIVAVQNANIVDPDYSDTLWLSNTIGTVIVGGITKSIVLSSTAVVNTTAPNLAYD
jgi:hypothetical protein